MGADAPKGEKARRVRRWAQVAEWLMAADCKSAVLWDYEGSNPSLCTSRLQYLGCGI
jgi:hypothetical protein